MLMSSIFDKCDICKESLTRPERKTKMSWTLLVHPEPEMPRLLARIIGDQLAQARERLGLSRIQAAKDLGVKRQMIYNYESGRNVPSIDILAAAANAWGIEYFDIEGGKLTFEQLKRRTAKGGVHIPKQLRLNFPESRTYRRASVRIARRKGALVVTAIVRGL
jgi:transcriptional regulator with XRE-family HTH domain